MPYRPLTVVPLMIAVQPVLVPVPDTFREKAKRSSPVAVGVPALSQVNPVVVALMVQGSGGGVEQGSGAVTTTCVVHAGLSESLIVSNKSPAMMSKKGACLLFP